jgi:4-hydroxyproline epimerase
LIDHIEVFADDEHADSRNFVLCPGGAYDRSPCGTGTSAKLACLAADGKLQPGQTWRQASIIGSVFEASYERDGDKIVPTLRGRAHISAEATLLIEDNDPFGWGIRL